MPANAYWIIIYVHDFLLSREHINLIEILNIIRVHDLTHDTKTSFLFDALIIVGKATICIIFIIFFR